MLNLNLQGKNANKQLEIIQALVLYSLTSASLLLVNKLLMHYIPLPAFVSVLEFLFCVLFVLFLAWAQVIEIEEISNEKLKTFSLYVLGFTVGIYSNMSALQASTVETVIIFRACTPLCVSFLDYFFLRAGIAFFAQLIQPDPRHLWSIRIFHL